MAQGLRNYSLLKGRAIDMRHGSGASPHLQVLIADDQERYRIAVNVQSQDGSMVQYLVRSQFQHPICDELPGLQPGLHRLEFETGRPRARLHSQQSAPAVGDAAPAGQRAWA